MKTIKGLESYIRTLPSDEDLREARARLEVKTSQQADTLSRVTHTVLYIVLFHFTFYQTSINKHFINEDISGKYEINI